MKYKIYYYCAIAFEIFSYIQGDSRKLVERIYIQFFLHIFFVWKLYVIFSNDIRDVHSREMWHKFSKTNIFLDLFKVTFRDSRTEKTFVFMMCWINKLFWRIFHIPKLFQLYHIFTLNLFKETFYLGIFVIESYRAKWYKDSKFFILVVPFTLHVSNYHMNKVNVNWDMLYRT